jgi:hypothetical protein
MSSIKCKQCGLVNWGEIRVCKRCNGSLEEEVIFEEDQDKGRGWIGNRLIKRALVIVGVVIFIVFGWFLSLIDSSERLSYDQKQLVYRTVDLLDEKGFGSEAFILRYLVTYRGTDNWWNRWVGHADAFAATNFPFEIVTLYPEFFDKTVDDTERAAILLHEAYHLKGKGEPAAFAGVWRDKERLGWHSDKYSETKVWKNTKELTLKFAPELFQCGPDGNSDCLETD